MTRSSRLRRPQVAALVTIALIGLLGPLGPSAPVASAHGTPTGPIRPVDPIAHDPTMVQEYCWYYVAITGDSGPDDSYLPMKRSRDLVHWQELGPVLSLIHISEPTRRTPIS